MQQFFMLIIYALCYLNPFKKERKIFQYWAPYRLYPPEKIYTLHVLILWLK